MPSLLGLLSDGIEGILSLFWVSANINKNNKVKKKIEYLTMKPYLYLYKNIIMGIRGFGDNRTGRVNYLLSMQLSSGVLSKLTSISCTYIIICENNTFSEIKSSLDIKMFWKSIIFEENSFQVSNCIVGYSLTCPIGKL